MLAAESDALETRLVVWMAALLAAEMVGRTAAVKVDWRDGWVATSAALRVAWTVGGWVLPTAEMAVKLVGEWVALWADW